MSRGVNPTVLSNENLKHGQVFRITVEVAAENDELVSLQANLLV